MDLNAIIVLDFISTFAFAWVGARVAASKNLDYGGIFFVAGVSAVAGGTFRNLVLQMRPAWLDHPYLFIAIAIAVILTIIQGKRDPIGKIGLTLDSFGLAFAVVAAVEVSLKANIPTYAAIILGSLSGVIGGLTRDVLCQVPPVLLHRETSGTVSLLGAIVFVTLYKLGQESLLSALISGLLIVALRLLSVKFRVNLPKLNS
ncbi:MAG: hypothetical protein RL129_900 [Actinomycetota bacterium]